MKDGIFNSSEGDWSEEHQTAKHATVTSGEPAAEAAEGSMTRAYRADLANAIAAFNEGGLASEDG